MTKLTVKNFSCIKSAEIELGDLTVLIGPQASGKSVISKLIYFANDVLQKQYTFLEYEAPFDEFVHALEDDFLKLFPSTAWRRGKFEIEFEAGPYTFSATGTRRGGNSKPGKDKITVTLSNFLRQRYERFLRSFANQKRKSAKKDSTATLDFQFYWRLRDSDEKALRAELGGNYAGYQLFIPAGRSFFTSIGKAVAAFERSGMLDPITVEFGRTFASMRDRSSAHFFRSSIPKNVQNLRRTLMQQFFGGTIEFGRDEEFVSTSDGRKIPFSVLSSGQQELLPLWMVIDEFSHLVEFPVVAFIEEPEAHLFPAAQSEITQYLASFAALGRSPRKLLITTHSPYVLSSVNNLLKAGELANRFPEASSQIEKIIPKNSWLNYNRVRGYALVNGETEDICREGLLDGDYIDSVSGTIASEFSRLLEIESTACASQNASRKKLRRK